MIMKRYFILAAVTLLVVTSAISTAVLLDNNKSKNDLFSANVEALVQDETIHPDGYVTCFHSTYDDGSPGYYLRVRNCFDCNEVDATSVSDSDKCMP